MFKKVKRFFYNLPISIKMTLITILVGTMIWLVLNHIQTAQFTSLFQERLQDRFSKNAEEDRYRFDQSVKALHRAAKLLSEFSPLVHYIEQDMSNKKSVNTIVHRRPPVWLPSMSVLRDMVPIRYSLLVDSGLNVREIFKTTRQPLPDVLLKPTPYMLELSNDQTYLTLIDGIPFLVASKTISIENKSGDNFYLILVTPIDSSFLIYTQGGAERGNIIALLDGQDQHVLTSSKPEIISTGMSANNIREAYLVTDTAFFDYGAADLLIRFVSMTPTDDLKALENTFILRGIVAAIAFIIPFLLIMYWITHRIQGLNKRINVFIENMNLHLFFNSQGDELNKLENRFVALSEEIIEETKLLEHQALHDSLTKLPNRSLFNDRFDIALKDAKREGHEMSVMILDLDKFKEINDILGHHIGDEVLKEVSIRFAKTLRATDTVARFGGDEFAILLTNSNREQTERVAKKLVEVIRTPIETDGHKLDVGTSIGIAMFPEHTKDKQSLLQFADRAMYDAKRGRTGYKFYDPETTGISHISSI
ncbi:MAG: GGDEF domain-containing protein [Gammaproteobacteria bacterium]|nr:GGDEF domain-containing protein [Gammaproteobacteria bacterium]